MVGLGERFDEVVDTMRQVSDLGVKLFTIGQYLQPSQAHLPVDRYVAPEAFDRYREWGLERGFLEVVSGPMVRSSYRAEQALLKNNAGISNAALKERSIPIKQL